MLAYISTRETMKPHRTTAAPHDSHTHHQPNPPLKQKQKSSSIERQSAHALTHTHTHTHAHAHAHASVHARTCTHKHAHALKTHTHSNAHTHTHTHTHEHALTHTLARPHVRLRKHNLSHTHTRAQHTHTHTKKTQRRRAWRATPGCTPSDTATLWKPAHQAPRWGGGQASAVSSVSRWLVLCQAPRWSGGAQAGGQRSLRRRPPTSWTAGRGGLQARGGAGPRVPRVSDEARGIPRARHWHADVSLGAARRAWGIPLAGGASPLPRVKYPGRSD
jgi:hypothetical protein